MKSISLLALLLLFSCAPGTTNPRPENALPAGALPPNVAPTVAQQELASQIVEFELQRGQAGEILRDLTSTAPHRLSGSEGADRAVLWAMAKMQNLGLTKVRAEKCAVPHWERGEICKVEIGPKNRAVSIPALALGGSIATPKGGLEGEVVVVRSFKQLAALGDKVKGKIVLFNRPMPRALMSTFQAYGQAVPQRTQGAVLAAEQGAIASIVRSMTTALDDTPHTGVMRYQKGKPQIPAAAISTKGAEEIAKRVRTGQKLRLRIEMDCRTLPDKVSANVVGCGVSASCPIIKVPQSRRNASVFDACFSI